MVEYLLLTYEVYCRLLERCDRATPQNNHAAVWVIQDKVISAPSYQFTFLRQAKNVPCSITAKKRFKGDKVPHISLEYNRCTLCFYDIDRESIRINTLRQSHGIPLAQRNTETDGHYIPLSDPSLVDKVVYHFMDEICNYTF